ncbi:MAG TPA: DNA-directed RNA polymerase subunit omega [Sporosarcina sp.]|nr:DNA-directed RNA polymerase subunit omega [Sporosarcina sp.]
MLHPSIDALQEKIESKYTLVSLAAMRAREMQEQNNPQLASYKSHKFVGKALEEVVEGVLTKEAQDESIVYEDEI